MKRRPLLLALPGLALAAEPAIWTQSFRMPGGGELRLADFKGRWLLLNFWATWCAPCVKEMPELDRFHRKHAASGWPVIGLAVDGPTPVREFLTKRPVSFPIGLAGLNGSDLARSLGNLRGGLPFTVLINPQAQVVWRHPGETTLQQLETLRGKLLAG